MEFTDKERAYFREAERIVLKMYGKIQEYGYVLKRVEYQAVAGINMLFFYELNYNTFKVLVYKPFAGRATVTHKWG